MNLKLQKISKVSMAFLMTIFSVWGWSQQTTIAFNGAEASPSLLTASNTFTSSTTNSGTPTSRIKSGTNSFQRANGTGTFISEGVSLSGYSAKVVEIWNSMVSTTTGNGIDSTVDKLEVYVSSTSTFSQTPDVTINSSAANVRWGMNGTGVVTTTAGTPITQTYSVTGTRTGGDAFSKISINLPNAWGNVYIKIISVSNASEEVWCIDDIAVKGEIATSTNPPTVTASSFTGAIGLAFAENIVATESPTSYIAAAGSTLPLGLSLDASTGAISGTPSSAGTFTTNIIAENSAGSSSPATITFVIGQGSQTLNTFVDTSINFNSVQTVTLPAQSDQGLAITYVSSNPSVASISGNILTFSQAGTVSVTASQAGNSDYNSLSISKNFAAVSTCFDENFASITAGNNTSTSGSGTIWNGNVNFPTTVVAYSAGGAVKLGTSNNVGSITSLPLNNIGGDVTVSFTVKGWSTIEGDIAVTFGGQTQTVTYSAMIGASSFESKSLNFINVPVGSTLKIATTNGRAFIDNVAITCGNVPTWTGTQWAGGVTPTASTDAIINGDYTGTSFTANNLVVNSTRTLTINSGQTVTAVNTINNGNIIVNDGGNFVQTVGGIYTAGAGSSFIANRNSTSLVDKYAFWSSPVASQNLGNIYIGGTPSFITEYNTATDYFVNAASTSSVFAKGYSIKTPVSNASLSFQGVPNNGPQTFALSTVGNGFNLVGNPYPSNLSLDAFYTANSARISSTMYFWDNKSNSVTTQGGASTTNVGYATFNAAGSTWIPANNTPGAVIPVGAVATISQGFFVKALSPTADPSLALTNDMRVATAGTFFNKNNSSTDGKFWLRLNSSYNTNNTFAVTYSNGASNSFDQYDSKAIATGSDAFYTLADAQKLVIQGRESFNNNDVVPVGAKHFENGGFTISLAQKEGLFTNGQAIYLHDKVLGTYTNLQNQSYAFTANAGEVANRFEIVYKMDILATSEVQKAAFEVYKDGGDFFVRNNKNIEKIEVYDAAGRKIKEIKENTKLVRIKLESRGIYILKAISEGKEYTKKIIK